MNSTTSPSPSEELLQKTTVEVDNFCNNPVMKAISGRMKSSKHPASSPAVLENIANGNGPNCSDKTKENTLSSIKAKSVEEKLDKLASHEKDGQQNGRKSLFRGHTFCMDPEQMGIRLNLKNTTEKKFLGITISRSTPQVRLHTLNNLLMSIPSDLPTTLEGHGLEKTRKQIYKNLQHLKNSVCGDISEKILNDKELAILTDVMVQSGFISTIVMKIPIMEFEDRKTACMIWCNLFRRHSSELQVVSYLDGNPTLLFALLDGYNNQTLALTTGRMLRECIRYESLAKLILYSDYFHEIFGFLQTSNFEISSDAFLTLQDLLLTHKKLTVEYFMDNSDKFFPRFDQLLTCDNYVTQLGCMRFLGMMLMDRRFFDVMKEYVQDAANLKRIVLLMSSSSGNIQLEAFHIFKIFVANPEPPQKIRSIFIRNKEKLVRLLDEINDTRNCETFGDEKAYVIKKLKNLENEKKNSSASISSGASTSTSTSTTTSSKET